MVVGLAVRPPVALEEVPCAQLLVAVRAREVLRVPGAAQRRDHLCQTTILYYHCPVRHTSTITELGADAGSLKSKFCFQNRTVSTCPTMGFSQALQHPFWGVCTPWRLMSARRDPSICSREADSGCLGLLR